MVKREDNGLPDEDLGGLVAGDSTGARVVAYDPSQWSRCVIIDIGKSEGADLGLPVLGRGGIVGRIIVQGNERIEQDTIPAYLPIQVGDTVTWTNKGVLNHTVTADNNSFSSGTITPGVSYSHTFSAAGSDTEVGVP